MKKIILALFISAYSFSFSNIVLDNLVGPRWSCSNLIDKQLVNLIIKKQSDDKYVAMLNSFENISKNTTPEAHVGQFDLAINETEHFFYFTNLDDKSKRFENYRFTYTIDKKNNVKFSLFSVSRNKNMCNFNSF